MGANMRTPMSEIEAYLQEQTARRERAMQNALLQVGEQAVNHARSVNSYRDQTGNLRSSTGYVLVSDGKIVKTSSFETVKNGHKGSADGKSFAGERASGFPKGIVLIVVAGMKYAGAVSARGKDVLDSAELLAEQLVEKAMKRLKLR
jgi:hypothetical protein